MIDYYAPNIDLTLLGCGFLGKCGPLLAGAGRLRLHLAQHLPHKHSLTRTPLAPIICCHCRRRPTREAHYHLGAIYLLSQVWPHKPYNRICGASCGGLVGALIVSGAPFEQVVAGALSIVAQLRSFLKKPTKGLVSVHEILEHLVESLMPQDAHKVCNDRLGISLSKVAWPLENLFITQFESRRELIDATLAGCFIPLWSGSVAFPTFKGQKCLDGGYSNNTPSFEQLDHQTNQPYGGRFSRLRRVQMCAFASATDISPPGGNILFKLKCLGTVYHLTWPTLIRGFRTLIPFDTKGYLQFLIDGHRDMKDYILRNDMVRCRQCSYVAAADDGSCWRRSCVACLKLMEKIDSLKVPQNLIKIFE